MNAIVLLITVFYFSSTEIEPRARALVAPSAEECNKAGPAIVARLNLDPKVKVARWACFEVKNGDKV